jgi:N-methylhydantoinase A
VERGYDPRDFALIPFGGAGGLHAVELARALRIPTVIAPTSAGALSALGAVSSDVLKESSRTIMRELSPESARTIAKSFRQMEREAQSVLRGEGFRISRQLHDRFLSLRYKGQSFELEIPWTEETDIAKRFNAAHEKRYGYSQAENIVEIVSARVRSRGMVEQIELKRRRVVKRVKAETPDYAMVQFLEGRMRTAIYAREALKPGMTLRSPCIITEYSSTTLIPSGCRTSVDGYGNLIIDV